MDASPHFKGKKITLMGLGLLGRGVGDAAYLAEQGAELIITDLKSADELAHSLAQLRGYPNITYVLGEHRLEDFRNRDFIVKAAGVPYDSVYIEEARKAGIPIKMSASWFAELAGIPVIGITGTRGKSTTTHMLHAIMEEAGIPVLLGGNVRGVSTLALLEDVKPEDTALFELDSWQLQGFGEAKMSPHIAVFTTFFPDHLNYYKDDLELYLSDKANIFRYQTAEDALILGAQCAEQIEEQYSDIIKAHTVKVGAHDFRADWTLGIPGEHNRYDAALAVEAARELDIDDETIQKALENFRGVPGRLELTREVSGVSFYNDTTATTPEATLAALEALDTGEKNIILIAGGADKALNMDALMAEIPKRAKRVILLTGSGTNRVIGQLKDASIYDSLSAAVHEAYAYAQEGDIILFSPAFTSFGMFKNEYDRGDQFTDLVNNLPDKS